MKLRLPTRRNRADSTGTSEVAVEQPVKETGKGRPTPKRYEAQGRRPGPVPPPPTTRKEAYRRMREQQAARRTQARSGALAGDESYLPARDRGPERKLVRDVVDARRNVGNLFVAVAAVALIGTVVPNFTIRSYATFLLFFYFALLIVDSVVLGRRIKKMVSARFPQVQKHKGLIWYGVSRATMIRRWRFPKPEVKPGAEV